MRQTPPGRHRAVRRYQIDLSDYLRCRIVARGRPMVERKLVDRHPLELSNDGLVDILATQRSSWGKRSGSEVGEGERAEARARELRISQNMK